MRRVLYLQISETSNIGSAYGGSLKSAGTQEHKVPKYRFSNTHCLRLFNECHVRLVGSNPEGTLGWLKRVPQKCHKAMTQMSGQQPSQTILGSAELAKGQGCASLSRSKQSMVVEQRHSMKESSGQACGMTVIEKGWRQDLAQVPNPGPGQARAALGC